MKDEQSTLSMEKEGRDAHTQRQRAPVSFNISAIVAHFSVEARKKSIMMAKTFQTKREITVVDLATEIQIRAKVG